MIDGDGLPERGSDDADPETWTWEQHVGSGDVSTEAPVAWQGSVEKDATPSSLDFFLSEDLWGDEVAAWGPVDPFPADGESDDIWSLGRETGAGPLGAPLVGDPPRGKVDGLPASAPPALTPGVRPAPPRPTIAAVGVRRGQRTALRLAALALVVVATGGLLQALAARGPDRPTVNVPHSVDAAGLQSTSTNSASTIPRAASTTAAPAPSSPSIDNAGAPVTLASPSVAATAATTPATTAAPRSPVPAAAATTPVTTAAPSSPVPAAAAPVTPDQEEPPPAPMPPPTEATPSPPTIVLLPPGTTVTTRRPRGTDVETTDAPSTTVPRSDGQPVPED